MNFRQSVLTCVSVFLAITAFTEISAQTFVPIRINLGQYPSVKAKIYALDATGKPQEIAPSDVTVSENGTAVTATTQCDPSSSGRNLSLLVAMDITASNSVGSPSGLDLMKNAARGVSQLLTSTSDEIGLLTIDAQANLVYALSTDKANYTAAVDAVKLSGGLNLTNGFMNQPMGGLIHLQNARNNRALVLITDGAPSFDILTTLGTARTFGIRVYIICISSRATDQIKRLADSSGGAWAENVTTTADAVAWAQGFVADAKEFPSCKVSWTASTSCVTERNVGFKIGAVTRTLTYELPANALGVLEASTLGVDFGQPSVGNTVSRSIVLKALNEDVIITSFTISNPLFSLVNPPALPLTVRKDQIASLTLQFTASNSDGHIGLLTFASATCDLPEITMRGGTPLRGDVLRLKKPNGGENFLAGTDTTIVWENTLPQEIVRLEISFDGGLAWQPLAESVNGLSYNWRPGTQVSDKVQVRVSRTIIDPDNIVVLKGHDQPVYSAIFTADGQHVITGGHDGTVRLWNAFNGIQERLVGTHGNWVWALDIMPNTRYVASASYDGSVRVWDYTTSERIATIPMEGEVYTVAFTPDGRHLLAGTARGITQVSTSTWSVETVKIVDQGPVYDIDISQSGNLMAVAEGTNAVVRDVSTLEVVTTCDKAGRSGKIYAVALSPNASRLVAGGTDFVIAMYDAVTGAQTNVTQTASGAILALEYAPSGTTFLSGGGDGTVKIYDATNLVLQSSLGGHTGLVYDAKFSPNGKRVVSASTDFTARIWTLDGIGTTQDASDNTFRITGPGSSASTIDLGDVAVGAGADKKATAVSPVGTAPLTIISASFVRGDVSDFNLLTTALPKTITIANPLQLDVSFVPKQLGPRSADIDVVTGTGIVRVRVTGNGINPTLISPTVINYGRRLANQAVVDTMIILRMPSGATGNVNVNTTTLTGSQSNQFSIQSGGGSFTLSPGQSRQVLVRFEPIDFGRFAAELVCDVQNGTPIRVRLYGEGTGDGRISTTQTILFPTDPCTSSAPPQKIDVQNFGNTQLQIFVAGVEGLNASEFTVTPPSPYPIKLDKDEKVTFTVTFNPSANGVKNASVVISSSAINAVNGRSVIPISARRDSVGFELTRPVVNFANINEGQESIERLQLLNTGTVALRWAGTSVTVGRFRIENFAPEVTQPGTRSEMTIRFLGGTAGTIYNESYTFIDSVCGTRQTLRMVATVKSYIGATLRIDRVRAATGQEVAVPVYITNKVNFDRTNVTQLETRLLVNGTILTPTSGTPMGTFRSDGMREIPITFPIPLTDSLAATLRFRTSWGNDTSSVIHIDTLILTDTLEIKRIDGDVSISDICREGGARLIDLTPVGAGVRVAPLPASSTTTAVINIVEAGRTTVELVDINGRVILVVADRVMQGGSWFVPLDLTIVPNGSYYLVMTTPSQRIVERIEVVR
ncbi:MAG: choice-of-anchor D domain-containing protein [Candidatus Kapabacteria bacterium]|nr:choice-of-anchor D domain-containing protein [Candidatus Kapabacteria bacterium]